MQSNKVENKPYSEDFLSKLNNWIDHLMIVEGQRFLDEVPRASHLTDDSTLDINYYIRHRIEAIWRIWMTARVDALATASMVREDYESARSWSRYASEELDHDLLFLADLSKHGVSPELVKEIGPFPSTQTMVDQIEEQMSQYGSLPAVAYALFVEWNADRFSSKAVCKAEKFLSANHVAGAKSHTEFDITESHYPMIVDIIARLLTNNTYKIEVLERSVKEIAQHFRQYFTDLDSVSRDEKLFKYAC